MDYKVLYTVEAERDLERLDPEQVRRILKKIAMYAKASNPFTYAKQLKGFDLPTYRFRVGDYRIVFRKDPKSLSLVILVIIKVAHRKDVYQFE